METTKISQKHAEEMHRLLWEIGEWWRITETPLRAHALITTDDRPIRELVLEVLQAITDDNA